MAESKRYTDVNPAAFNPQTGLNTYEIDSPQGRKKIDLWAAGHYFEANRDVRFDQTQRDALTRRLGKLYNHFGQPNVDETFALDAAFSPLSDDDMMRLAKQRMTLNDSHGKNFFQKAWHYTLGAPIGAVFKGMDWVYDSTMNGIARTITHDDKATFHGLIGIGVMTSVGVLQGKNLDQIRDEHGYDAATHTFRDKKTGQRMDMQEWMQTSAPGWVKAADFAGYFIDPFIALGAIRTARMGARVVRAGEIASEASKVERFAGMRAFVTARKEGEGLWTAYKSMKQARGTAAIESFAKRPGKLWGVRPEDVERLMKGELQWADYFKGENLRDIYKAQRGKPVGRMRALRDLAAGGDHSILTIESTLKGVMPGREIPAGVLGRVQKVMEEGKAAGKSVDEIFGNIQDEAIGNWFDYARHDEVATAAQQVEEHVGQAQTELKEMVEGLMDPFDPMMPVLGEDFNEHALRSLSGEKKVAYEMKVREIAALNDDLTKLRFEKSSIGFLETLPRPAISAKMSNWLEARAGVIEDVYEAPTLRSMMRSAGHGLARSARNIIRMNPHGAIEGADDMSHVQYRRWLDEADTLLAKDRLIGSKVRKLPGLNEIPGTTPLSRAEKEDFYSRYVNSSDDIERRDIVAESSRSFMTKAGFNDEQVDALLAKYQNAWSLGVQKVTRTAPGGLIPLVDPRMMRQWIRWGADPTKTAELVQRTGAWMEKLQRGWKVLAVTRPAWATRVVLFSEQPRLAMAGLPNLITHPLIALASSQVPGATAAAKKILGLRLNIPVMRSAATMRYEALDALLRESDGGRLFMRSPKARKALGQLSPGFSGGPGGLGENVRWDSLVAHSDKKAYKKGLLRVLNDWLPGDELHAQFRQGLGIREARQWADSEAGMAWRNRHGLELGSPELKRAIGEERRFFEHVTKNIDPEQMGNLRLSDIADVEPPAWLPPEAWADTLDRPGMAMNRANVNRLMNSVWDMFSAKPSYFLSRHGPSQIAFVDELTRRAALWKPGAQPFKNAKEVTAEKLAEVRESAEARDAYRAVGDTLEANEATLRSEYIQQRIAPLGPQARDAYLHEVQHNQEHRMATRAFLDEMSDSDELVVFRGHAKGRLWEGEAGNASLDYRQAQKFAGEGGTVTELRIRKNDIISIGAGGEDEVLFWKRDAHVPGQKVAGAKPRVKEMFQAHAGKSVSLTAAEQSIVKDSWAGASAKVRQAVYDLAESSRAADLARFVAPFGNAWQEEVTRWASLMWTRPLIPTVFAKAWQHKDALPFSYKDARTGEEMFFIPWSDKIVKMATGLFSPITGAGNGEAMPLTGRWKNVNIITGNGFLPGFGPWTVLPAKALERINAVPSSVTAMLNPYGSDWKDVVMPSAVVRGWRDMNESDRSADSARQFNSILAATWQKTGGKMGEEDFEHAENMFHGVKIVNMLSRMLLGSGIKPNLPPQMTEMANFYKWAATAYPAIADDVFIGEHGDDAAAFMVHYTRSTTGAPPTKEGEKLLLPEGMGQYNNKAFWAVMSERARGEFDPVAYTAQIARGEREVRTGREFVKAAQTYTGWYRYGIVKDEYRKTLAALGINPRSDKAAPYKAIFDQKVQRLFAAYPTFQSELEQSVNTEWKQNQRDLWTVIHQPFSKDLESTAGAKAYFSEMRSMVYGLRQAGFKSFTSEKAKRFAQMHSANLEAIFRAYPSFRNVYNRLSLDNFEGRDGEWPVDLFSAGELG